MNRYSPSTGGFYPICIDYDELPSDLIDIDDDTYYAAINRQHGATLSVVDNKLVVIDAVVDLGLELGRAKSVKLTAAAQHAQAFIAQMAGLDTVPGFEQATWAVQAAEANAWAVDSTAATPMLSGIAAARGIDIDLLRSRALAKSVAYAALSASVTGQRQAYEDAINAATDIAAVDAIKINYTAPEA